MCGKPEYKEDLVNFILSKIKDRTLIDEAVISARDAITEVLTNGVDFAMNKYN